MSIISIKKYCVKGYRRISHRKGYGVHSPFVYTLITRVIEEGAAYYAYDEIVEKINAVKSTLDSKRRNTLLPLKTAKLLFRIINKFKPSKILECGTSYGISTAVMQLAAPNAHIFTIEPDETRREYPVLPNRQIPAGGSYSAEIPKICGKEGIPEFIYIREHAKADEYRQIFAAISPNISDTTVIFAEGMHKTEEIYHLFSQMAKHEKIKIFMDMYDIALYIASPKLNKERYKESF